MKLSAAEQKKRKDATRKYYDVKYGPDGEVLNPECVTKTSQAHKDRCDINKIMEKAERQGLAIDPMLIRPQGRFGDFTNVPSFMEALNISNRVKDEFMALKPEVRAMFGNDPAALLKFVEDPANEEKCIELGLFPQPVIKTEKLETPEGVFWVTTRNGKEIKRVTIDKGVQTEVKPS